MRIVEQSHEILTPISEGGIKELQLIERAARVCYKSEGRITADGESAKKLIRSLIERGHEAMLEHSMLSILFVTDRGVSHELVRHRMASFAQESTRYCRYQNGITVVRPLWCEKDSFDFNDWASAMARLDGNYMRLLDKKQLTPQQARAVLPTCLKTELVVTANYREWRHILRLRTASDAHPDMRALMIPLLAELKEKLPVIFDDIVEK